MASISLSGVQKAYGDNAPVIRDVDLEIGKNEFCVFLGPSGCGKSTLLRMIAGLEDVTDGDVSIGGKLVNDVPAAQRGVAMVFQSYALFPHMTVARNVRFGLEMRRLPKDAAERQVAEMLRLVKLEDFADRMPRSLSGGQQQRVALARALAIHPRLLLLDEPLSNLDAALRQEMAREIRILQRDHGITALVVTHDQAEAMAMADRLVVMRNGGVEQIGRQEDLYMRPATPFVAGFIGHSNIFRGRLDGAARLLTDDRDHVALAGHYRHDGPACLAVRPESIRLLPTGAVAARVEGSVKLCTYLGTVIEHVVRLDSGHDMIVRGPGLGPAAAERWAPGERVSLTWHAAAEHVFDDGDRTVPDSSEAPVAAADGGDRVWAQTK